MNKPFIVLILTLLFLGSCDKDKDNYNDYSQKIVGTWVDLEGHKWVFAADGKLIYEKNDTDHEEYDYKINGNKMSFIVPRVNSVPDMLQLYNIYLSNNGETLDLTGGTIVTGWIIAGPGWSENKLNKISG